MKEIIFGKGGHICTAIHLFALSGEHRISDNDNCYWITHNFLNIGYNVDIKIFKDTPEAEKLKSYIDKDALSLVNAYLDKLVCSKLQPRDIKDMILEIKAEAYVDGRKDKIDEIKSVLEYN